MPSPSQDRHQAILDRIARSERPEPPDRWCVICGTSIKYRRRHAVTCSAAHRRIKNRLEHLLAGRGDGRYRTVQEYLDAHSHGHHRESVHSPR